MGKPENILIVGDDDGEGPMPMRHMTVKVIDFGFAKRLLDGVQIGAKVGTFVYTAPETLSGSPCDGKVDLWALGCVVYVMLSGQAPFAGNDCRRRILDGSFRLDGDPWPEVSED